MFCGKKVSEMKVIRSNFLKESLHDKTLLTVWVIVHLKEFEKYEKNDFDPKMVYEQDRSRLNSHHPTKVYVSVN